MMPIGCTDGSTGKVCNITSKPPGPRFRHSGPPLSRSCNNNMKDNLCFRLNPQILGSNSLLSDLSWDIYIGRHRDDNTTNIHISSPCHLSFSSSCILPLHTQTHFTTHQSSQDLDFKLSFRSPEHVSLLIRPSQVRLSLIRQLPAPLIVLSSQALPRNQLG
jgi:hypothetical protein